MVIQHRYMTKGRKLLLVVASRGKPGCSMTKQDVYNDRGWDKWRWLRIWTKKQRELEQRTAAVMSNAKTLAMEWGSSNWIRRRIALARWSLGGKDIYTLYLFARILEMVIASNRHDARSRRLGLVGSRLASTLFPFLLLPHAFNWSTFPSH